MNRYSYDCTDGMFHLDPEGAWVAFEDVEDLDGKLRRAARLEEVTEVTQFIELTQSQLSALLQGCQIATSLVLGEELPAFYSSADKQYHAFVEAQKKLHEALARMLGLNV